MEELIGLTINTPVTNFPSNPSPQPTNPYAQFSSSPKIETNPFSATPSSVPIASQINYPQRLAPPPPTGKQNLAPPRSMSVSNTNPFAGVDFLGDLSSNPTARPTKESFFAHIPPPKTIQQLQMEKQVHLFLSSSISRNLSHRIVLFI